MEMAKSEIVSALWASDVDMDSDIHWDYSGRGMYGRTCFGFVGNEEQYAEFLYALIEEQHDDESDVSHAIQVAREFSSRVSRDSMGYDTIFYFPGITVLDSE